MYFTLCIGLATLIMLNKLRERQAPQFMLLQALMVALAASAGQFLEVDYHWKGILFIVMFYYMRNMQEWIRNLVGICAFAYEGTAPLAFLPIHFYDGTRGKQMKYLFYAIYPIHLLIFGLIRLYWY